MTKTAIITIGCSGSGKTFWAKQFIQDNPEWVNINRDEIRKTIYESENNIPFTWKSWKWKREPDVTKIQLEFIENSINNNKNIIISDTNLNIKTLNKLRELLENNDYVVELKIFNTRLDICFERDAQRDNPVGFKVIGEQFTKFCKLLKQLNNNISDTANLYQAVICDLDGTLFLMNDKRGAFEYDKVHLDDVNIFVRDVVKGLNLQGKKIIFFSGRDDSCYEASFKAIQQAFDYKLNFELYMRVTGDKRCDTIVKEEMYNEVVKDKYRVHCVIDDRSRVANKWRELGLNVLQVGNPYHWF